MNEENLNESILESCRARFREASRRAEELFETTPEAGLVWKPVAKRWSAVECIEHLTVSAEAYWPGLFRAIELGKERGAVAPPYRRGTLLGHFVVSTVRDHPDRRVKAPRVFQPACSDLAPTAALERFRRAQERWEEALVAADGIDLGIRLATPVSRFLRVSLRQAFEIHSHHELRHVAQAERLRSLEGFPGD